MSELEETLEEKEHYIMKCEKRLQRVQAEIKNAGKKYREMEEARNREMEAKQLEWEAANQEREAEWKRQEASWKHQQKREAQEEAAHPPNPKGGERMRQEEAARLIQAGIRGRQARRAVEEGFSSLLQTLDDLDALDAEKDWTPE